MDARVRIAENTIEVRLSDGADLTFTEVPLPPDFLRWQSEARLRLFDILGEKGAEAVRGQPAHLPVMATMGEPPFATNLASRGVGVVPRREHLEEFTQAFEEARRIAEGKPWKESLGKRVEAARMFYQKGDLFDSFILGGLEIFEGRTAANLTHRPLASLLYTGEAPKYLSYQFNSVVRRVEDADPYYKFLLAARQLFAFDRFHIKQDRYPYGYLCHVVEVLDKTPFPRS
jgi:hypothetical protein